MLVYLKDFSACRSIHRLEEHGVAQALPNDNKLTKKKTKAETSVTEPKLSLGGFQVNDVTPAEFQTSRFTRPRRASFRLRTVLSVFLRR